MKHFQLVCILSIIAIAYAGGDSEEEEARIMKFVEECQKETKASDEDVAKFEEFDFPKTKTETCFTACYYKKTGVVNDDNSINIDKALEEFEHLKHENKEFHGKLVTVMKDCHSKYTPVKECDSIKPFIDCVLKSAEEAGIPLEK